jgi:hypothetical protein
VENKLFIQRDCLGESLAGNFKIPKQKLCQKNIITEAKQFARKKDKPQIIRLREYQLLKSQRYKRALLYNNFLLRQLKRESSLKFGACL